MLGSIGNFANLLKQAGQMKENLARMQQELAARTFTAEAGGGMVKAVVNGKSELVDLRIDPQAAEDLDLLQELVKGAVAAALRKAQDEMRAELIKLTGGVDLPGVSEMLGGGAA